MSLEPVQDFEIQLNTLQTRLGVEVRKLELVREVATALGSTLDLERLLDLIMSRLTDLLDADRSTLYLMTDDGLELSSKYVQGGVVQEIRLGLGEGIAGWVASSGKAVNIADAYADPRFNPDIDRRTGYRTRSTLCMPMRTHDGRIVGVMQVLNKRASGAEITAFTREDEALVEALSSQAAVAIENAKLYRAVVERNAQLADASEKLQQKVYELDLLFEVESEMHAAQDVSDVLDRLLKRAMDLVAAEAGSIVLSKPGGLQFSATRGGKAQELRHRMLPGEHGIVGWVIQNAEPLLVPDPMKDSRFRADWAQEVGYVPRNLLCVPLLSEDATLGALELCNKHAGPFLPSDLKLLTLVAGQASKAIQLARAKDDRLKETRLASIGQMLSSVLHDLKTPMTIISGYAQLMAECEDGAKRGEYREQILRQFGQLSAMTREVLAFARGESTLLVRKVYLQKFCEEVAAHLGQEFAGRNVHFEIDKQYAGVAFFDEAKLLRVVHNLARNAAEAMPQGGSFCMTVAEKGSTIIFAFADTGSGIPAELEGRIFEPFTTSGKRDGTGLGLAIVKKIVEEHLGSIDYASEPGRGTTFTVRLPKERASLTADSVG